MSEIKVNSIKGVGASTAAITVNNTDGTCTANITNNLSNRRININGAMICSQRGTSFTNIGSGGGGTSGYDDTYVLDRFLISQGLSAGRCSVTQENDAPSGFSKSLKIATTTADTSTAAGEYHRLLTKFEGQDLQRFAKGTSDAKQFTLSFYCKANASATYVAELHDTDNDRSISKTFSVTTSWTRVKLTFAADTTGAFNNDNLLSMTLALWFHAGSTYSSGTLQTNWGSMTAANRAVGIDSIFDSTNRTFFITGVQLEVGSTATDFEHRSFGQELALCQRYYYLHCSGDGKAISTGSIYTDNYVFNEVSFPVSMRANPSLDQVTGSNYYAHYSSGTADAFNQFVQINDPHLNGCMLSSNNAGGVSNMSAGKAVHTITSNSASFLAFSAEL